MEPFFFGERDKPLYGVFHSANPDKYRARSVLLLYPLGQEYLRIHRAYRRLTDSLAQSGFDVLRFDYAGTGDSWGTFDQVSIAGCVASAVTAYDELKALSPESRIDVVSLRFGTLIARELVEQRSVGRLVLWEVIRKDADFFIEFHDHIARKGKTRANFVDPAGTLHYNGYAYSSDLQSELRVSKWNTFQCSKTRGVYVISTVPESAYVEFRDSLEDDHGLTIEQIEGVADWAFVDAVGGLFFPEPSLNAIVKWLTT